ncbi:MAG: DUF4340 domain-containing protein [Deltaproteobacteria bacterium]|nr:DUF4340 domain-containing protein [Deltaproteobacteria bacterium]MBI3391339.1 DUF4340 domain-containing protein [Deltaproteobacteria bacterium]
MRFRTTLILLLVAAGLGAYVYFVEFEKAAQEAKKKTVFEFKADDATAVSLTYFDHAIELTKSDAGWRITKPIDVAADDTAAKNLVTAIAECELKKELENPQTDLSVYALDKPFVTVKVKLKDKDLPAILVGKNTPVGFFTYISRDDDKKVLLTSSAFRSGMDKQVKDLRDKAILAFADDDVRKVSIVSEHQNLQLAKKDDTWTIERPATYPADPATIRTLLSTLKSMRAVDFPTESAEDLAAYGLDTPRLVVALTLAKNDSEIALLVGKENDKKEIFVKASTRPTIYTVSEWVFKDLNKELKDFRDKTVLAFDKDAVRAVDIKRADGAVIKLARGDDQKWRVDGAADAKPLETAITQYLSDLHDLKGFDIVADKPGNRADFGLEPPLLSIALRGANDAALGGVLIGRRQPEPNKSEYTAMAQGTDTVFLVRDYVFTRLDKQQKDFIEQPTPVTSPSPALQTQEHEEDDDEGEPPAADEHFGAED